jgi:hypothetical protein
MVGIKDENSLVPDYWDEKILDFKKAEFFRRYDSDGVRFYYKLFRNSDGKISVRWYRGVTSIIGNANTQAEMESLMNWAADMGENFNKYRQLPANYGTMMHEFAGLYLMALRSNNPEEQAIYHNLDYTNKYIDGIIKQNGWHVPEDVKDKWYKRARHNMMSIKRFCEENKVVPIAIEFPCADDELGLAGTIDAIVKMTIEEKGFWGETYKIGENKGKPKETKREREIYAIVDFKFPSGAGIYRKYAIQLEFYRMMIEKNYNIKIERVYNMNPMNQSKSYNYGLTDQTGLVDVREMEALMILAEFRMQIPDWGIEIPYGIMEPNKPVNEMIKTMNLNEYLINKYTSYEESNR